ncbi:MAG: tetratricopeptide repeat protein [Tannerellaceae bacterium]|jgi:tetratricopeptide (TPR) repeat protein|nr:tetratricopeptide repeat protein [Tannerellaceae bacterium]
MGNFFKTLFSSSQEVDAAEEKEKNDRKNFELFKYDGIRAQQMHRTEYAIKCYLKALSIQEDFETLNHLATAYIANHELEEALEALNRMIALDPEHTAPLFTRINVLFMLDREEEAIKDCMRVIESDASNPIAWFLMGRAKKQAGDLSGAIAALTSAIELKDDFTSAYLLRAEALLAANQLPEALSDTEKALSLEAEEESAYLVKGRVHEAMGDLPAATADYEKALELNPFNEEASLHLGAILTAEGKTDEAIRFFDELIELKPEWADAYRERSKAKRQKGDDKGAQEDLRIAAGLDPESEEGEKEEAHFDDLYKGGIF